MHFKLLIPDVGRTRNTAPELLTEYYETTDQITYKLQLFSG